jgi:hypothetical protein
MRFDIIFNAPAKVRRGRFHDISTFGGSGGACEGTIY